MVNTEIRLIIFFAAKDGEAPYSQQKQDQELTVAQIMNSLLPNSDWNWKKLGKTTESFRYDLNQIPYDYTVQVRNRFTEGRDGPWQPSCDPQKSPDTPGSPEGNTEGPGTASSVVVSVPLGST